MGLCQSFDDEITNAQERYVATKLPKVNTEARTIHKYTQSQIKSKLREEYHGRSSNRYVTSYDWGKMNSRTSSRYDDY